MKRRLVKRSRRILSDSSAKCDICDHQTYISSLEVAYIIKYEVATEFYDFTLLPERYEELSAIYGPDDVDYIPDSVNASSNGLLLCEICLDGFNAGKIKITEERRINIDKDFYNSNINDDVYKYEGLDGALLWWLRDGINIRCKKRFPTKVVFQLANDINDRDTSKSNKRKLF